MIKVISDKSLHPVVVVTTPEGKDILLEESYIHSFIVTNKHSPLSEIEKEFILTSYISFHNLFFLLKMHLFIKQIPFFREKKTLLQEDRHPLSVTNIDTLEAISFMKYKKHDAVSPFFTILSYAEEKTISTACTIVSTSRQTTISPLSFRTLFGILSLSDSVVAKDFFSRDIASSIGIQAEYSADISKDTLQKIIEKKINEIKESKKSAHMRNRKSTTL